MRSIEVEIAVANYFGIRQNIIVPNASWGMGVHECDLLVIRRSGYAAEVEIKVSKADLKKDAEKHHGHYSNKIKHLYFAVPESLYEACVEYAPPRAGILIAECEYHDNGSPFARARVGRVPITNKTARPFTAGEITNAARLGCMRIWGLKEKLAKQICTK